MSHSGGKQVVMAIGIGGLLVMGVPGFAAEHGGEGHDLFLATAALAGLFVVTLGANILDDVLALELLLHATQRTVDRLILTHFDLDGHGEREGVVFGKGDKEPAALPTVNPYFCALHALG